MLQCHFQGRAPTEEKSSASLIVLLLPSRAGFRCQNLVPGRCLKVVKTSAAYDEENHVANLQQVPTSNVCFYWARMALCNRGKGELGAEAWFWSLLLYLAVSPSDSLLLRRTLQLVPAGASLSVPHPLGGPQSKASIASFWWSQGAWPERSGVQCSPRTCRQPFGKRREDILGIYGGEPFFR